MSAMLLFCPVLLFSCLADESELYSPSKNIRSELTYWVSVPQKGHKCSLDADLVDLIARL